MGRKSNAKKKRRLKEVKVATNVKFTGYGEVLIKFSDSCILPKEVVDKFSSEDIEKTKEGMVQAFLEIIEGKVSNASVEVKKLEYTKEDV